MKKFSVTLVGLLLLLGTLGTALPTAHAAPATGTATAAASTPPASTASAPPSSPAKAVDPAAEKQTQSQGSPPVDSSTYGGVMTWIMGLFAWLLGVAAVTLDNAVYYTVVTMGSYVHGLSAIGVAWQVLRDIGNIVLIFGFLAVGITIILNVDWYGGGTRMIPVLLLAAVFINFSLFVSSAVIDVGNLFATQFYTQINGGQQAQSLSYISGSNVQNEGISNKIMAQLGLTQLYGGITNNSKLLNKDTPWYLGFMGILLFLIAAFVMFSLAFILIARFIILILLMIVAPIGFAGLAVPKLSSLANKWWKTLFEQTITAPVLLLMLYVALRVITDTSFMTGFGGNAGGWTGFAGSSDLAGFAGVTLSFLVAMGLLLAVTILAKSMSAFGAGAAMKLGGLASFGATAFVARRTVGRAANATGVGIRNTRFGRSGFGSLVARGFDYGGKSSFDLRGTNALKSVGIDAGAPHKGGYAGIQKKAEKEREDYAKTLKETAAEREAKKDVEKRLEEIEEGRQKALSVAATDEEKKKINSDYNKQKDELEKARINVRGLKIVGIQTGIGARSFKGKQALDNAPKADYADDLSRGTPSGAKTMHGKVAAFVYAATAGARANRVVGGKLKGELKNSKDKKALAAMKDYFSEDKDKSDESGGKKS